MTFLLHSCGCIFSIWYVPFDPQKGSDLASKISSQLRALSSASLSITEICLRQESLNMYGVHVLCRLLILCQITQCDWNSMRIIL